MNEHARDPAGRRFSVLLVDDMPALRVLVRVILESSGSFSVVGEACDGAQAIDLAGDLRPDVVLLDLAMPRMDGLDALPSLRTSSPDSAVIILSGSRLVGGDGRAPEHGAAAWIEKDSPAEALPQKLLDILTEQSPA